MAEVDLHDPRAVEGDEYPAYRPGVSGDTWWKVTGWNPGPRGGACAYERQPTREHAIRQAQRYRAHGDETGRRYEHWDVLEMVFEVVCRTTVHDVPEAGADA